MHLIPLPSPSTSGASLQEHVGLPIRASSNQLRSVTCVTCQLHEVAGRIPSTAPTQAVHTHQHVSPSTKVIDSFARRILCGTTACLCAAQAITLCLQHVGPDSGEWQNQQLHLVQQAAQESRTCLSLWPLQVETLSCRAWARPRTQRSAFWRPLLRREAVRLRPNSSLPLKGKALCLCAWIFLFSITSSSVCWISCCSA